MDDGGIEDDSGIYNYTARSVSEIHKHTHQLVGYMSDLSASVFVCFCVNSVTHRIIAHMKPGIRDHFTPGTGSTDKHVQTSPLFQLV